MKTKPQQISVFLLGIFLFVIGFKSLHVVEHYQEDLKEHKCSNHKHTSQKEDCSICDFTFSAATDITIFSFDSFHPLLINTKVTAISNAVIATSYTKYFSLRAPPILTVY
ncbi:MAG: hypothetical protein WCY89_10160 [Flavobacteriaceae bacterium]